ncbi:cysteine rich repeat-containing protein [Falsiroseomonas selenitidurans]|uniref:Cysteine rich repeat protein n=1 Tax=Falsiroseomonas selenitidurans TaxID=2716335 RepID=A0ABX1E3C9_9PROT|nr:cysteine rich repeat-containing protein [Falsiroseomonas selenitidurans]NKC31674.1 hypothetical protein [Falsiroseomonas selenitidurans]
MSLTPFGWPGLLALAALPLLVATTAAAQGGMSPAQRQATQACLPDIRSHCATVERGGGRIVACLRQNGEKLSPACRQALSGLQR